jgi:hypothetical protein
MRAINWFAIIWGIGGFLLMGLLMNTSNQCISPDSVVERTSFIPLIWIIVLVASMVYSATTRDEKKTRKRKGFLWA